MGAVEVSREGGLRHKSVLGGADKWKDPIYSGMVFEGMLRAWKQLLSGGGMVTVLEWKREFGCHDERLPLSFMSGKLDKPCCRAGAVIGSSEIWGW